MVLFVENKEEKEKIASTILHDLPDWFGLADNTQKYISKSGELPFWVFMDDDNVPVGFIVLKETSQATAEIYVMGVLKKDHGKGYGTALWKSFLHFAKEHGFEYAQVKTVQSGRYVEYDQTNLFYKKLGFKELEVFPTLWDEQNPCQVYVKYIG